MSMFKLLPVVVVAVLLGVVALTNAENTQVRESAQEVNPSDEAVRAAWVTKWEAELEKNAAALDGWREDFNLALESDAAYTAAVKAVRAVDYDLPFDQGEYAALIVVRDDQHRRIARHTFEQRFGPWQGDEAELDVLFQLAAGDKVDYIVVCTRATITTCGTGKVKSMAASADGACAFVCAIK